MTATQRGPGQYTIHQAYRPTPGPRYRPPWVLRALVGMVAFGSVLFVVALMWSDRAPGILEPILSSRLRELWYRVDPQGLSNLQRSDLPRTDFMLHATIWSVVTTLVITTVWTWRWLVIGAMMTAGASYLIELGQGRYSSSRTVDVNDAIANTLGVFAGMAISAVLFVLWNGAASILVAVFDRGRSKRGGFNRGGRRGRRG